MACAIVVIAFMTSIVPPTVHSVRRDGTWMHAAIDESVVPEPDEADAGEDSSHQPGPPLAMTEEENKAWDELGLGPAPNVTEEEKQAETKSTVSAQACLGLAAASAVLTPLPIPGTAVIPNMVLWICCPVWMVGQVTDFAKKGKKNTRKFFRTEEQREAAKIHLLEKLKKKLTPAEFEEYQAEQERKVVTKTYDSEKNISRKREMEQENPWLEYSQLAELLRMWPLNVPVADCSTRIKDVLIDLKLKNAWLPEFPCKKGGGGPLPDELCKPKTVSQKFNLCEKASKQVNLATKSILDKFEMPTLSREDAIYYRNRYCPYDSNLVLSLPEFAEKAHVKIEGVKQKCCCPQHVEQQEKYCKLFLRDEHGECKKGWTSKAASCKCLAGPEWMSAHNTMFKECIVEKGNVTSNHSDTKQT